MGEIIKAKVCAVNENDGRVNFNFIGESISESWCIGPTITNEITNPVVGQKVTIYGDWISDVSGNRLHFHATHIE